MSEQNIYFGQSGNEPEQDASWAANRIAQLEAELAKAREERQALIDWLGPDYQEGEEVKQELWRQFLKQGLKAFEELEKLRARLRGTP